MSIHTRDTAFFPIPDIGRPLGYAFITKAWILKPESEFYDVRDESSKNLHNLSAALRIIFRGVPPRVDRPGESS